MGDSSATSVEQRAMTCSTAPLLIAAAYFAGQEASSYLIVFDDEAAAEHIGVPRHGNPVVALHKNLAAIGGVGGPGTVEVECRGGKTSRRDRCTQNH